MCHTNRNEKKKLIEYGKGDILEIGVFEGLGTNMLYDMLCGPNNKITCIDPFPIFTKEQLSNSSNKIKNFDVLDTHKSFVENTKRFEKQLIVYKKFSYEVNLSYNSFYFIYVDGDHTTEGVYKDSLYAFELIVDGGNNII
jgi:hypothetical protein